MSYWHELPFQQPLAESWTRLLNGARCPVGEHMPPWHCPFTHVPPAGHTWPHCPQFAGSFASTTHAFPHFVVPPPQVSVQTPFEHAKPAPHA